MATTKIATCCYCGAKTALVLKGKSRHELACGQCGAPLSRMKMLPKDDRRSAAPVAAAAATSGQSASHARWASEQPKGKKRSKKKSLKRKIISELWDVVEDIFD